MRIGIISMYSGDKFKNDTKYGRQTLLNYCKKHDYDFIEDESCVSEHNREIQWTKILLIQKYLQYENEIYDYLIWIDADILIMNLSISIESFINRLMNNKHIMYSKDFGGWVNNGVIFIKNTKEALDYFIETWNHTDQICREQGSMDYLYRMNWNNCQNIIEITQDTREYNPTWFEYDHGQFLLHFPGCGEPNRLPNSLKRMMDMFTPIKMDEDTEETYLKRLEWLKNEAGAEMRYKKQLCIQQGWKYLPIDLN